MKHVALIFLLATIVLMELVTCSIAGELSHLDMGILQYRAEQFEEALVLLQEARMELPQSSMAAFYLGMARKQTGEMKDAIRNLREAATMEKPVLDAALELADAYRVSGDYNSALTWITRAEEAHFSPARTTFLKGLILLARGEGDRSVVAFEQAKRLDASLSQSADFQIAIALAGDRKLVRARDTLRAVIAADPTSEIATYAREYEQSFSRIIESYRPLRLTVGLNYMYDDNAISNPSDATARAQIGNPTGQNDHAFLGTLRLDYNPMLAGNGFLSVQYALYNTSYGNTNSSDENPSTIINSLTIIPGMSLENSAFTVPINYSHVLLKEERYQQAVTIRPTWSYQLSPQQILQTSFSYSRREMLKPALVSDENRDASIYGGSLGYIHTYGNMGGMAGLRYDYSYDDAEGQNWVNNTNRVSLNSVLPLLASLKLNLSAEVAFQDYLNTSTLFGVRRNDTTWLGSAGLTWDIVRDVAVNAQYVHTTAESNIPVYGYQRNTLTAGVELSF